MPATAARVGRQSMPPGSPASPRGAPLTLPSLRPSTLVRLEVDGTHRIAHALLMEADDLLLELGVRA